MASQGKDINRVAGGLKATVHNPKVSDEAKASAQERLEELGLSAESGSKPKDVAERTGIRGGNDLGDQEYTEEGYAAFDDAEYTDRDNTQRVAAGGYKNAEHNQVMGGYKATINNPQVSQEAKQHAQRVLDQDEATE